jgi:hypothetical protein
MSCSSLHSSQRRLQVRALAVLQGARLLLSVNHAAVQRADSDAMHCAGHLAPGVALLQSLLAAQSSPVQAPVAAPTAPFYGMRPGLPPPLQPGNAMRGGLGSLPVAAALSGAALGVESGSLQQQMSAMSGVQPHAEVESTASALPAHLDKQRQLHSTTGSPHSKAVLESQTLGEEGE